MEQNPTQYEPIQYEERIIAYIDVLGFRALVMNHFDLVQTYFKASEKLITELRRAYGVTSVRVSDSIIFTVLPTLDSLRSVLGAVKILQTDLLDAGLLIRGAITVGSISADSENGRIVGPGFIKAYDLERNAIFPRVLIDPAILSYFDLTRSQFLTQFNTDDKFLDLRRPTLVHDFQRMGRLLKDGDLFISYLSTMFFGLAALTNEPLKVELEEQENRFYQFLRKNIYGSYEHVEKYRWLRDYTLEVLMNIEDYVSLPGQPLKDLYMPRTDQFQHQSVCELINKYLEL